MKRNISLLFIFIYFIFISYNNKIYAEEIIIKNKDNNFYNFHNILSNTNNKELILKFVDEYYDFKELSIKKIQFEISNNVSFIGSTNRTIFDFSDSESTFTISYINENQNTLIFENIIFQNFKIYNSNDQLFNVKTYNFGNFIWNNCTFNNNDKLFYFDNYNHSSEGEVVIQFNSCNF